MSAAFYDYVRGLTDTPPAGYELRGLRVYRRLVYLGVSQTIDASFPELRQGLGEAAWEALITDFVRQSAWSSPFIGDLEDAFRTYLATLADAPDSSAPA